MAAAEESPGDTRGMRNRSRAANGWIHSLGLGSCLSTCRSSGPDCQSASRRRRRNRHGDFTVLRALVRRRHLQSFSPATGSTLPPCRGTRLGPIKPWIVAALRPRRGSPLILRSRPARRVAPAVRGGADGPGAVSSSQKNKKSAFPVGGRRDLSFLYTGAQNWRRKR